MRQNVRDVTLTNDELASIYDYLRGNISHRRLTAELKKARTNSYFYIGRAVDYWLQVGILQFASITKQEQLGGKDIDE